MTFILLYWKWFAAAAIVGMLTLFYNVHVDGVVKAAVTKAVTERDDQWRQKEQEAINKARADALVVEKAHQTALAAIQAQAKKDSDNAKLKAKAQHDKDMADALSGRISLRVPASICASGPDVPGAASGGNPAAGATIGLPPEIGAGLYSLADDATAREFDVIGKLNTCWQIVASDRKGSP